MRAIGTNAHEAESDVVASVIVMVQNEGNEDEAAPLFRRPASGADSRYFSMQAFQEREDITAKY